MAAADLSERTTHLLLGKLTDTIRRNGGRATGGRIVESQPAIRKALGDVKFLDFLQAHPDVLEFEREGRDVLVRVVTGKADEWEALRQAENGAGWDDIGGETNENRVKRVSRQLEVLLCDTLAAMGAANADGGAPRRLSFILSQRKVKGLLRPLLASMELEDTFSRAFHVPDTKAWFVEAVHTLCWFAAQRPELFELGSVVRSREDVVAIASRGELSSVTLKLTPQAATSHSKQEAGPDRSEPNPARSCSPRAPELVPCPPVLLMASDVVVVDKPAGHTTESIVQAYQRTLGSAAYLVRSVSRLDQPTSGALVLPLSTASEAHMIAQFKTKQVDKIYVCLCLGMVDTPGEVVAKLRHVDSNGLQKTFVHPRGKDARTQYAPLCALSGHPSQPDAQYCLLAVRPLTGRTHQIRAHLTHIGHPLAGDRKYNAQTVARRQRQWCPRLFLHAFSLSFTATDGARLHARSDLPSDLLDVLHQFRAVRTLVGEGGSCEWFAEEDAAALLRSATPPHAEGQ